MDDEREKLTSRVSKTNSVVKMLKRQIAKESKGGKSGRQGFGHGRSSTGWVSGDVSHATSELETPQQETSFSRCERRDGEYELSHRRATTKTLESIELADVNEAGGSVPVERRPGRTFPGSATGHSDPSNQEGHSSAREETNSIQTGANRFDYGATGYSDNEETAAKRTVTFKAGDDTDMTQARADGERVRSGKINNVHQPSEPWTIDDNTHFVYGPSFRASRSETNPKNRSVSEWWNDMWSPYGGFHRLTSVWIYVALTLLLISNCLFISAFVTNNWGILHMDDYDGSDDTTTISPLYEGHQMTSPVPGTNDTTLLRWVRDAWDWLRDDADGHVEHVKRSTELSDPELHRVESEKHIKHDRNISGVSSEVNHAPDRKRRLKTVKHSEPSVYWRFGLWQCCRNTDNLCLGVRWAAFYSAIRAFSVLSLFGMILSFSWMLGHTLEKLLDYDICTMSSLISLCYATTLFTTVTVATFGIKWPTEFRHEFDGTDPHLSFSFYLATFTVPLTLTAAICITIDLKSEVNRRKDRNSDYYTETELSYIDAIPDIPTDNISRSRLQKKKRRGQQGARYTSTGSPS